MKKVFSICCIVLLTPVLTACGGGEASYTITEPGTWTDGTYTQSAKGYRGDIPVTVTIKDGKMTDITVGDNNETPDRGGKAIEKMPPAMLDAQSYDVDGISSATRTSDALRDAVARSLEQASKDSTK